MGKALSTLAKEEDVLVIGSGLITHNLRDRRAFMKQEVPLVVVIVVVVVSGSAKPVCRVVCRVCVRSNGRWSLIDGSRRA
jgi:hypothetical protein